MRLFTDRDDCNIFIYLYEKKNLKDRTSNTIKINFYFSFFSIFTLRCLPFSPTANGSESSQFEVTTLNSLQLFSFLQRLRGWTIAKLLSNHDESQTHGFFLLGDHQSR